MKGQPVRLLLIGVCLLGSCAQRAAEPPSSESPAAPAGPGAIAGTIRYTGTVPPPQKIPLTDGSTLEHSDLVVDPKTQGLRYVLAVLENAPVQPRVEQAEPVVVDQRGMVFLPRVVAVQHGQAARFENNDLCNHSVMASSILAANQLNVIATPGQPVTHVFQSQKNPVQIGCSLHPWMRAWVYVLPHPWFAVSDEQGQFRIERVPPGRYTLWLRHADTGLQERRELETAAGKTVAVDVELLNDAR
jgi:plastocyanin